MNITLRKYQEPFFNEIWSKLFVENIKRIAAVLPTGGGKSVIIGKLANELPGRTLILTHREEILFQNSEWIENVGILSSKVDTIKYNNKVIVCMVQTLYARIEKYGISYLGKFDNIILDEIQILIFEKVFNQYNFKRLIGLTGTPILNKKKYTTIDDVEFVEPYTLSEIFDDIVIGPDTQDLIDSGNLCQDYNIALQLPDFDKLKESDSTPDGYTKKSLDEVYSNTASLNMLTKGYNKYCSNKKTLIFNSSTKVNKFVYEHFLKLNLNVKLFDSVNKVDLNPKTGKKYTRKEIIKWFESERDAILINTNVFTTGFNVTDVECVIVNRATKSLSLWIQMVGRGSRTTDKIYKDKFTVLDLGQNIHNHGIWSKRRDWKQYFRSPGMTLKNNIDMLSTWECSFCQSLNIKGEVVCGFCNMPKEDVVVNGKQKKNKEGELIEIGKMPPPKASSIIKYTLANNEDVSFAFKLLRNKITELFEHHKVSREFYIKRKKDFVDSKGLKKDGFETSVRRIFTPIYFAIIKNKELNGVKMNQKNRKINTEFERIMKKIDKIYNYEKTD